MLDDFKEAIKAEKVICPKCGKPVKKFEKFVEKIASVWDGFGDSRLETEGSRVTLICNNAGCPWTERTDYWSNYVQ